MDKAPTRGFSWLKVKLRRRFIASSLITWSTPWLGTESRCRVCLTAGCGPGGRRSYIPAPGHGNTVYLSTVSCADITHYPVQEADKIWISKFCLILCHTLDGAEFCVPLVCAVLARKASRFYYCSLSSLTFHGNLRDREENRKWNAQPMMTL